MKSRGTDLAVDVPRQLENEIRSLVAHIPHPGVVSDERREALFRQIKALLKSENAVLVTHYYVDDQLQILTDQTGGYVGDSLGMADFGNRHSADTLIVIGVRFMGETAKILNPEKRVLMPELDATCSLDLSCPAEAFTAYCDAHPERVSVVYANTSAAVKARADWMVTSSNAIDIVSHLHQQGKKIIWASDKHLGNYIQEQTGADMLIWQGFCVVHDEFRAVALKKLMDENPNAEVLAHPESPASILALADFIGSTTQLIKAAASSSSSTLIVATDFGLFHKMREAAPDKTLIAAPTGGESATCVSCAHCPWMAMNSLESLVDVLETGRNAIHIPEPIRVKALRPIERMLAFSRARVA